MENIKGVIETIQKTGIDKICEEYSTEISKFMLDFVYSTYLIQRYETEDYIFEFHKQHTTIKQLYSGFGYRLILIVRLRGRTGNMKIGQKEIKFDKDIDFRDTDIYPEDLMSF